jgi:hypothetical protein
MPRKKTRKNPFTGELAELFSGDACEGSIRVGVAEKLRDYLIHLKESGAGRKAAASAAGLSYATVLTQRMKSPDFEILEEAAVHRADFPVEKNLRRLARSKGANAAIIRLYFERRGWVAPKEMIEIAEKTDLIQLDKLSPKTRKLLLAELSEQQEE